MRTWRKKFLSAVLMMSSCALLAGPALQAAAADKAEVLPTEIYAETLEVTEASGVSVTPRRGTYLQGGSCQLIDQGNCHVTLTGSTEAYEKVDFIEISLYLERYEGGDWVIVKSDSNSARNSSHVSVSFSATVTPGYNYRARAFHHILEGSLTETGESFTTSGTIEDN